MTGNLLHPLRTPRRIGRAARRREDRRHAARHGAQSAASRAHVPATHVPQLDAAVERVRRAGGPIDHASYDCECGYRFSASVSTTVSCPHCGIDQAW
ncbi:MAG TPA: hypothetical protein VFW29_01425 [Solirubrobacteraceae bacterium]|nr:hypothetical protein [Solirubrobacteraceae bacterium]